MSPTMILILVALTIYAIFRQTQKHEVIGATRFKMAIIYAIIGVCVGGFSRPNTVAEYAILAASLGLSIVIGLARGRGSKLWKAADGRVYSQGTVFTISLFIALIVFKFALGTVAYLTGISDDGGFGEIMLMIAVMIAFQAQLVWHRAQPLEPRATDKETPHGEPLAA